jgi:hypothetical protein
MDFSYDPNPICQGETGSGIMVCPWCGTTGYCDCDFPEPAMSYEERRAMWAREDAAKR